MNQSMIQASKQRALALSIVKKQSQVKGECLISEEKSDDSTYHQLFTEEVADESETILSINKSSILGNSTLEPMTKPELALIKEEDLAEPSSRARKKKKQKLKKVKSSYPENFLLIKQPTIKQEYLNKQNNLFAVRFLTKEQKQLLSKTPVNVKDATNFAEESKIKSLVGRSQRELQTKPSDKRQVTPFLMKPSRLVTTIKVKGGGCSKRKQSDTGLLAAKHKMNELFSLTTDSQNMQKQGRDSRMLQTSQRLRRGRHDQLSCSLERLQFASNLNLDSLAMARVEQNLGKVSLTGAFSERAKSDTGLLAVQTVKSARANNDNHSIEESAKPFKKEHLQVRAININNQQSNQMRSQKQSSPPVKAQLGSSASQNLAQKQQLQTTLVSNGTQQPYPAYLQNQLQTNQRDSRHPKKVQTASTQEEFDILNNNTNNVNSKKVVGKKKKTNSTAQPKSGLSRHASSSSQGSAFQAQNLQQHSARDIQFYPSNQRYREQDSNVTESVYVSTQQRNVGDDFPRVNQNVRQEKQKASFDYRKHLQSKDDDYSKHNAINLSRNNPQIIVSSSAGQARDALLHQKPYHNYHQQSSSYQDNNGGDSNASSTSLPRQFQHTGQALSKRRVNAQYYQHGDANVSQSSQAYLSPQKQKIGFQMAHSTGGPKMQPSKALRQQKTVQNTMLTSKKMDEDEPEQRTSINSVSSQGLQRTNIFARGGKSGGSIDKQIYGAQGKKYSPSRLKQQLLESSNQKQRMPFDLANSILEPEDNNRTPVSKNEMPRGPQNSLAQKMNRMAAAENDLSRKSQLGSGSFYPIKRSQELAVDCVITDQSIDFHNNPNVRSDASNVPRSHAISAKVPAKVKPQHATSKWQQMQQVQIEASQGGSGNLGSRLKHNMQIYSMPKRVSGAFQDKNGNNQYISQKHSKATVQQQQQHHGKKQSQLFNGRDVDQVAINVGVQNASHNNKRQSHPVQGFAFNQKASNNMPLANKYAHLGASWSNKEPNKFPSSSQSAQKVVQFQNRIGQAGDKRYQGRQTMINDSPSKQADISNDRDIPVNHPLLSKSQSGIKKRPSMYNIPVQDEDEEFLSLDTESLQNQSFHMMKKSQNERSVSYIGRLKNFLGLNAQDALNQSANQQRDNSAEDVYLNLQQKSGPFVPKLVLKELQSDEFEPVASQKFESPKETKQLSSHRFKCSCEPSSEPYACSSAFSWLQMANGGRKFDITPSRKSYLDLLGIKDFISMAEERQIECDITRTFPHQKIFQEPAGEGQQSLQRVLQAFSKYDVKIGYVQGMNFIVGALLLHCSEEVTFWLFVALIEDYEMRDIYMEGLPGHIKHSTLITQLMENNLPDLYEHFQEIGMSIEIFATDWYFTLFAKVIPTYQMNAFFDSFFEFGWCFFHKFTLTLLRILSPQILQMDDMCEIKQLLMLPKHKQNFYGNSSNNAASVISNVADRETNSEASGTPFQQSELLDGSSTAGSNPQSRTFLSSIGNLFGFRNGLGSDLSVVDKDLEEHLDTGSSVEQLLQKEDAWIRMIEISKKLWIKKLPDSAIIQYLHEYDQLQEQQLIDSMKEEAKFNDSDQDKSADEVQIGRASSPMIKEKKGAAIKKESDSPLPNGASFSSNELEDDHVDHPTNEMSPMKHVNDSGKRMPKQTKLMFNNIDGMRQGAHQSPKDINSRRTLQDQALIVNLNNDQFSKSVSNPSQQLESERKRQLLAQKRDQGDHLPSFGGNSQSKMNQAQTSSSSQQVTGFKTQDRHASSRQAFLAASSAIQGQQNLLNQEKSKHIAIFGNQESQEMSKIVESKQKARKHQYLQSHQQ